MATAVDRSRKPLDFEDEDQEETLASLTPTENSGKTKLAGRMPRQGVVVSGEASESDEELGEGPSGPYYPSEYDPKSSTFRSRHSSRDSTQTDVSHLDLPKYNTLLHKKLRDRNMGFRQDIVEIACQPYQTAAKEIGVISQQLIKSQILVQEVSCTLRRLTNELFQLEDKVDTIRSCNLLPEILIASMPLDET